MSRSNKRIKEKMIKIYGVECFIDKLQLRKDKQVYAGKAQYERMKQLTYHHIIPKAKGRKSNSRKWCIAFGSVIIFGLINSHKKGKNQ